VISRWREKVVAGVKADGDGRHGSLGVNVGGGINFLLIGVVTEYS
jgi:hypothetical protein